MKALRSRIMLIVVRMTLRMDEAIVHSARKYTAASRLRNRARLKRARISLIGRILVASEFSFRAQKAAPEDVASKVLEDPNARVIVEKRPYGNISAQGVIELFEDKNFRSLVGAWLRQNSECHRRIAEEIARVVREFGSTPPRRCTGALRAARIVVTSFLPREAQALLELCLERSFKANDPYAPRDFQLDARETASDLLVGYKSLDNHLIKYADAQVDVRRKACLDLLARAIGTRLPDGGKASRELLAAAPTRDERVRLAGLATRPLPQRAAEEPERVLPAARLRSFLGVALSLSLFLMSVLVACAVGVHTYKHHWTAPPYTPGFSECLAALALLATVVVFTTQFSASRLPGPLSSVASRPEPLSLAFSSVVAALGLSLYPGRDAQISSATSWMRITLTAIFILASIIVVARGISRTDPVEAVDAFRRSFKWRCASTGSRLGEAQGGATIALDYCVATEGVEVGLSSQLVGVRQRVLSTRTGLLLPSKRGLRRLVGADEVRASVARLAIVSKFGQLVTSGQQLGAVFPLPSHVVSERITKRLDSALRVRRLPAAEEIPRKILSIYSLAFSLARDVDRGAAGYIGSQASGLLVSHLLAARKGRRTRYEAELRAVRSAERRDPPSALRSNIDVAAAEKRVEDVSAAPEIPAVEQAIAYLVAEGLRGNETAFEVAESSLDMLVRSSTQAERAALLLRQEAVREYEKSTDKRELRPFIELLKLSAVRALELEDRVTDELVMDDLRRLSQTSLVLALEASATLASLACWISPRAAGKWLKLHLLLSARNVRSVEDYSRVCRIGGSALSAGAIEIAFSAASELENDCYAGLRGRAMEEAPLQREAQLSQRSGGYLGPSPRDGLADFDRFFDKVMFHEGLATGG